MMDSSLASDSVSSSVSKRWGGEAVGVDEGRWVKKVTRLAANGVVGRWEWMIKCDGENGDSLQCSCLPLVVELVTQ